MSEDAFDGAPNPAVAAAQAAIATKLGLAPEAVKVTIGNLTSETYGNNVFSSGVGPEENTTINVSLNLPGVMFNDAAKDKAKQTFKEWEATKKWQWDSDFEQAKAVNASLTKATAGLDGFNTALLDSPVFKTDDAKKTMVASAQSYALSDINVGDYGVSFTLRRPTEKDVDHKPELKKIAELIDEPGRNAEIREVLTQRMAKNLEIKLKAEGKAQPEIDTTLAKAKADMGQVIIKANVDDRWDNGVRITIRSPEQAKEAAGKQNPDYAQSDNGVALRAGNPLSELDSKVTDKNPHPALQKSLARALFHDKEKKVRPEMISFMGSMDIKAALGKEFARLGKAHPEKVEEFNAILKSELFKIHGVDQKVADAGAPNASMDIVAGKNDVVQVRMPVIRKELEATLQAMANEKQAPQSAVAVQGDVDLAAIADTLVKAGNSLAALTAKLQPTGSYAKTETKRAAEPGALGLGG